MNNKTKSTSRVENYRERQLNLGRKKKEYYLTDYEHECLKIILAELRERELEKLNKG